MSVLQCCRRDCGNIMCDKYSHTYGYICDECFAELVSNGADTNIESFMQSPKNLIDTPADALSLFSNEFTMVADYD